MPTPVSAARQCLTPEAAQALDEAVGVAKRRGHSQTTSLHAVSALLSIPSSLLRDACLRAKNTAYTPRVQFKALELCLSVSLDRVPTTQLADDPPVSNSLMAAIKRSQANQRRQPENFHLYHQQYNSNSMSCVKVELPSLIFSILDDPVVSRIFGESGFRSSEIKLSIVRPLPQVLKLSKFKGPPMFLCNLTDHNNYSDPGSAKRSFTFPFSGFATGFFNGDENCRRIGEALVRTKGRNPLLLGVYAYDALTHFCDLIHRKKHNILPCELHGLSLISMETDIKLLVNQNLDKGYVDLKFNEVNRLIEQHLGLGLVVNLGDMKVFINGDNDHNIGSYIVEKLTKLLQLYGRKVWFIGSISSYECFANIVSRFSSIEKEWDLHLLPITSFRSLMADSFPRSSLMESFIPFGGFFSTTSELNPSFQCVSRCRPCNDKFQQELLAVSQGGFMSSVADQYQSNLPSWLQMTHVDINKSFDMEIRDDGVVLSAKVAGLQKKWDTICQRLHHTEKLVEDQKDISMERPSKSDIVLGGLRSSHSFFNSDIVDGNRASPMLTTSVTTGLGLRICPVSGSNDLKKPVDKHHVELSWNLSDNTNVVHERTSENLALSSSSSSSPDFHQHVDPITFKKLFKALSEKVSWQDEAVRTISQTIAHCTTRNDRRQGSSPRRHIWFNFIGPDKCGKRKIAMTLAEVVFGSRESLISADLSSQEGIGHRHSQQVDVYNVKFRGKTIIDYIVMQLRKMPLAVVFLENVDKADVQAQNSLLHAIRTGRFSDSHGREVGINNAIFVTTSTISDDKKPSLGKDFSTYSEERILTIKGKQFRMIIEQAPVDKIGEEIKVSSNPMFVNKRKLVRENQNVNQHEASEVVKRAHKTSTRFLDLNLPVEENEQGVEDEDLYNDSPSSKAWLQDFFEQLDKIVVFKPFDFHACADRILVEINNSFHKLVESECLLDIDSRVVEQLLAAAYLSEKKNVVEEWVEQVLSKRLVEATKRYNLNADSVVKLIACKCVPIDEQMQVVSLLPSEIIMN